MSGEDRGDSPIDWTAAPGEPATSSPEACYFLFSSNQRPQYEQDIVDVIGSPAGSLYRFRYIDRYIDDAAKNPLPPPGSRVLIVYSIQQKAKYHDPAYIPVRVGSVTSVTRHGGFLAIDFVLGGTCCVPIEYEGESRQKRNEAKRDAVRKFTSFIHAQSKEGDSGTGTRGMSPREGISFSFGILPASALRIGADAKIFQDLAELLQDTASFSRTRFLRFERMTERASASLVASGERGHTIEPGRVYDLWFQQWTSRELLAIEKFRVAVDQENIKLIGSDTIEIASTYDIVSLPIVATTSTTMERRHSLIAVDPVDPTPGVSGPRIKIPVIIEVPTSKKAAVVGATTAAALLLGLPSLVAAMSLGLKVGSIAASALVLSWLGLYGLRR